MGDSSPPIKGLSKKGQRGETKGLALARLKRMKNFDVDSTSLKIFPCLTHTQTFDRRPFPMYSQHELCRWKHRKNCECCPGLSSVSQKSLKGLSKASAPQYFSSSYTKISSSASRPDTKYFPLHLPPPNVFQKYTSSSFSCLLQESDKSQIFY